MRAALLVLLLALTGCVRTDAGTTGGLAIAPDDPREALRQIEDRLVEAPYVSFRIPVIEQTAIDGQSAAGPWTRWRDVEIAFGPEGRMRVTAAGPHPDPTLAASGVLLAPSLVTDGRRVLGGRYGLDPEKAEFDGHWGPAGEQDRRFWIRLFLREGIHVLLDALAQGHTGVYTDLADDRPPTADVLTPLDTVAWGSAELILGEAVRELRGARVDRSGEYESSLLISQVYGRPVRASYRSRSYREAWIRHVTVSHAWEAWSFEPIPDSVFVAPE
ncbi:MAG: hypothetical protein AAGK21_04460 [Bacteroidota bacterium]